MPPDKGYYSMESFYRTHAYLVEHTNAPVRRDLMDEIDWNDRLIGIKGTPGKMSSSKGKVIDLNDVLRVYQPEVVRYLFAGTRPNTEFVISFDLDVIKIYEDYDKTERIAFGLEKAKNESVFEKERRIWELSQIDDGNLPSIASYQIPFRHLCNLLQINGGDVDAVMASLPGLEDSQRDRLRTRAECAWYWISECAPGEFRFSLRNPSDPDSMEIAGFAGPELNIASCILKTVIPHVDELDEKELSTRIYAAAENCGVTPKELFVVVYRILILFLKPGTTLFFASPLILPLPCLLSWDFSSHLLFRILFSRCASSAVFLFYPEHYLPLCPAFSGRFPITGVWGSGILRKLSGILGKQALPFRFVCR